MKHLLTSLALTATLFAASTEEINALIDAIVAAEPQARYEKVNAFKLKMRALNAQQRQQALESLQQRMYPALDPAHTAKAPMPTQHQSTATRSETLQQMRLQQQFKLQNMPDIPHPGLPGGTSQPPVPTP